MSSVTLASNVVASNQLLVSFLNHGSPDCTFSNLSENFGNPIKVANRDRASNPEEYCIHKWADNHKLLK